VILLNYKSVIKAVNYNKNMDFYEEMNSMVKDYISRLTDDRDEIQEVSQNALIKIHISLDSLRNPGKLTSWLKRIVYTTRVDYHRNKSKNSIVDGFVDIAEESVSETDNHGNDALIQCIKRLLSILPAEQRELLEAVELNNVSQTQWAKERNLPVSTVKSQVQRAKRMIKKQITNNCQISTDAFGNVINYQLPKADD
jgi:RNA polymerase sigma-70 factor (ECF subfamily)